MASKLEEISAVYAGERQNCRWGNTAVGEARLVNGSVSPGQSRIVGVKGDSMPGQLVPGIEYLFYGKWTNYTNPRTGVSQRQILFSSFVEKEPNDREGIISYLVRAGQGRGIGPARAAAMFDKWGSECVAKLRESPSEVATEIRGLSVADAEDAANWLRDRQKLESTTIAITSLLAGRGLPKSLTQSVIKEWGVKAAAVIRRDPYRLMAFRGVGFKRADALWTHFGLSPTRLRRQAMCAWHTIHDDSEGHTWFASDLAKEGIRRNIGGADLDPERAIELGVRLGKRSPWRAGALAAIRSNMAGDVVESDGCRKWVALASKAATEQRLAELIVQAKGEDSTWPNPADLAGISEHQREQLARSLSGGTIGLLGGSPGTGKTFTAARLIQALIKQFGVANVLVGAPTGKAAVRMTETLAAAGIAIRARTWHSILGLGNSESEFQHNESDPLKCKVMIGDESSMLDTDLFCSIMRARAKGCHCLVIGDVNQLPPVGHGAPLRDLIAAGLPYGELREIMRNSGGIVETCAAIRDTKPWSSGGNLVVFEHSTPESQAKRIIQLIQAARDEGHDPIWDCQVVVPVNDKSPISRKAVNRLLQDELNPGSGTTFRTADKIVNTKNGWFKLGDVDCENDADVNEQGEVFVANGELALVLEVAEGFMIAELSNPKRIIKIPRGKAQTTEEESGGEGSGSDSEKSTGTGCSWDLGYALSVHKSQGSEWPVVIVVVDEYAGAKRVCSREWLYTAISRAKAQCAIVGRKATADGFCRRAAIGKRKTFLRERIHQQVAVRALADL